MVCWLRHRWGKWSIVEQGEVLSASRFSTSPEWRKTGMFFVQKRTCSVCGKSELNQQESSL